MVNPSITIQHGDRGRTDSAPIAGAGQQVEKGSGGGPGRTRILVHVSSGHARPGLCIVLRGFSLRPSDGLTATVSEFDRAVSSLRHPGTSKTLYLCSSSRQCQEALTRSFIDRVLLVRNTATTAMSEGMNGALQDLKEPEWVQMGREEVSEFVGFDVGSEEDGQRGQYEMWTRQR